MTFNDLMVDQYILRALQESGYLTPTPIQQQAIPSVLEGHDLLGCAQTGTGKTAAFAIPVLQNIMSRKSKTDRNPVNVQALILTPTRELAVQVDESFNVYGRYTGLNSIAIYGGVSQHAQMKALRRGADILVATPGRLLDMVNQRIIRLDTVSVFVLDEADRMLDMGFMPDLKRIISLLPAKRQNLFFSATMPPTIQSLADSILRNPVKVEVAPVSSTSDQIQQQICFVGKGHKRDLLNHILSDKDIKRVLVFTRTKYGADKVTKDLVRQGISAEAIHGNKAQSARQKALNQFRAGRIRVLVATDIAARGIDVDDISHVINYELPNEPETYVHRIGRTGRAGASGLAVSFCDVEERPFLRDIQKLINKSIPVVEEHPYMDNLNAAHTFQQAERKAPSSPFSGGKRTGGSSRSRMRGRASNLR